tara:strand:+ start:38 stop:241 length:204 start_codon:yes stop_codon:yes gene_type:complete
VWLVALKLLFVQQVIVLLTAFGFERTLLLGELFLVVQTSDTSLSFGIFRSFVSLFLVLFNGAVEFSV